MLIGRGAERRVLDGLIAGARIGRSGVLVIIGEAGIGKTTLLDYAAGQAHGIDVTRIVGIAAERDLAFGALALALTPTAAELEQIPPPQARALRVALAMEDGDQADRFAVGAATLSLLTRRAEERPIALLLDDAHHLDRPSAEALAFAARRVLADPVLVVAALRSDEPSPLRTAGLATMIVPGMDESDTRILLARRRDGGAASDLSARVHQATGGNPLAILELASDLSALYSDAPVPVPAALAETFLRRAEALGPGPQTLLALSAAAGGDLRVVVRAGTALGIDPMGLAALESAALVRTTTERVSFTHPLVGSAIYASLAAPARRAVHAAIVQALPESDLERRAWHRAAAALGPDEGAARAVESVAIASMRRGAYAVAAAGFERSAALTEDDPGRAVRLVDAASAAWKAGDGAWSLRLIEAIEGLDPEQAVRTRALALRGGVAARVGSLEEAREALLRAASESAGADPKEAIRLVAEAVNASFYLADGALAVEAARLGERLLETEVDGASAALGHLAIGMARVLDGRDGAHHIREGVRFFSLVAADPQTELDSTWVVLGLLWLRESGATRKTLQAVEVARAETAVGALPRLLFHLARDGATTDRWVSAKSEYLESIALAEELGHETDEATSLAGLAWLEARQGLEEDCRHHAERALAVAVPRHINIACIWARFALGELDLAAGRMTEAVEGLTNLDAWLDAVGIRDVDVSPAPELVEALLRTGRESRAREVSQIHAPRARAKGQPWSLARAARIEGLLAPDDTLDDVFGHALDLHALTPDLFETARTRLVYGTRLRRARRRVDARAQLREALATFERLGAHPWAQTAAGELEATGETAARLGVSGVDLLTPRERQIVMLLAAGRTTRAAAAALFLSPKTVEYHLRHVYTKLAISSRSELSQLVAASPEQQ